MKRLLILLLVVSTLMVGCSSKTESVPEVNTNQAIEEKELTQIELNEQLKKDAIQAVFIEVNGGEVEDGTRLTATGEITIVMKEGLLGEFTLTTTEGNGYGMYNVMNMATNEVDEVAEGDYVQLWGVYEGKDDTGAPLIIATIIEKVEADNESHEDEGTVGKIDFQVAAEENAKQLPADSVATFEGERFKGMDYYYKGTIVGITDVDNNVGNRSSWLVENDRGYIMPIQHEYFEASISDEVEVWGTLSGNVYDLSSIGYEGIINKVGSMHAMMVTVNGEMQY